MKKAILFICCAIHFFCANTQSYSFEDSGTQIKFFKNDHHFMSLVYIDILGDSAFAWRPHPGKDPNGWGSTLYLIPFFPGAVLDQVNIITPDILPDNQGFEIKANGLVAMENGTNYGTWQITFQFRYDENTKKIIGGGDYHIQLSGLMSNSTGDLNLYRLASNYLIEVPLLCNPFIGNTGDMDTVWIDGGPNFKKSWLPPFDTFPNDDLDSLNVCMTGNYYSVDSDAQGHAPIMPAYKPSMKIKLRALETGYKMRFGAIYDESASQAFWLDNVGVTPLINRNSSFTDFSFEFDFESEVPVEQVEAPEFSECKGDSPVELEISVNTADAIIIYDCFLDSLYLNFQKYTMPIMIENNKTIYAQAYSCGLETSVVDSVVCMPTSVKDWLKEVKLKVYPNPASETLFINLNIPESGTLNFTVLNPVGQVVFSENVNHYGNQLNHEILLTDLKKGLYLLLINGKYADTFVKIN